MLRQCLETKRLERQRRCADLTRPAKEWRSKAQTSNGIARKSWEKQWLWMQGVALISKGKAKHRREQRGR
nr:MAG TPA: hypothetical protein [Caudoviricetes sp.]